LARELGKYPRKFSTAIFTLKMRFVYGGDAGDVLSEIIAPFSFPVRTLGVYGFKL
jgi:hypothetical protein